MHAGINGSRLLSQSIRLRQGMNREVNGAIFLGLWDPSDYMNLQ